MSTHATANIEEILSSAFNEKLSAEYLADQFTFLNLEPKKNGYLEDLEAVIQAAQDLLKTIPARHYARAIILARLSDFLNVKYKRSGAIEDLREAFRRFCEAVKTGRSVEPSRMVKLGYDIYSSILSNEDGAGAPGGLDEIIAASQSQSPKSSNEFTKLALYGPIVAFHITKTRSDAIIITESEIKKINLPNLKQQELVEKLVLFHILCKGPWSLRTKADRNRQMQDLLLWMWNVAVQPVIRELNSLARVKQEGLYRVWWVSSGVMGRLPVHAAGQHSRNSPQNTFRNFISSYIPSIKTLAHLQNKNTKHSNQSKRKVLVVAMPETPGYEPLDCEEEVTAIANTISSSTSATICILGLPGSQGSGEKIIPARKQTVLEELRNCNVVHFACHGVASWDDPLSSGFLLSHPTDDTATDKLTVQEIRNISQSYAQAAYLSACSTAENSSMFQDEPVHLAGGFQLIGFPHVIGTLWRTDDYASVTVARKFYDTLFRKNNEGIEDCAVAVALHEAIITLMEEDYDDVLTWAPYIHLGV